jgi:hypothetical protein
MTTTFKTGDRVRCTRTSNVLSETKGGRVGDEGVVTRVSAGGMRVKLDNGTNLVGVMKSRFEKIEEKPVSKFSAGDIVVALTSSACGGFIKDRQYTVKEVHPCTGWGESIDIVMDSRRRTTNGWGAVNFKLHQTAADIERHREVEFLNRFARDSASMWLTPGIVGKRAHSIITDDIAPKPEMKRFIVCLFENGQYAPAGQPKQFATREQAEFVARAMAHKHNDKTFLVLEAVSSSVQPRATAVTTKL